MSQNVSDYIWKRLSAWGVDRVYGYPGDGINGLLGAMNRISKDGNFIQFTQARHEEMAAFMACGHAKFTGKLGVCMRGDVRARRERARSAMRRSA